MIDVRNKRGSSLIEMLVTMSIFIIVGTIFGALMSFGANHYATTQRFATQQSTISNLIMNFRNDFERARVIEYDRISPGAAELEYVRFTFDGSDIDLTTTYTPAYQTISNFGLDRKWKIIYDTIDPDYGRLEIEGSIFTDELLGSGSSIRVDGDHLTIQLQHKATNTHQNTNRNMVNPVTYRFLMTTKEQIDRN